MLEKLMEMNKMSKSILLCKILCNVCNILFKCIPIYAKFILQSLWIDVLESRSYLVRMFCWIKGHHYACFSSSSGFMVYQVVCSISPDSIQLDFFHKVPATESISYSVSAWFLSRAQSPQKSPLTFWTHSLFVSFKCKKLFKCSFGSWRADVEWQLESVSRYLCFD